MDKYKISVIIPVYNAALTIGNILNKLSHQHYENIEVIAVNDGSKDDSLNILRDHAGRDRRIVVIDQNNSGVSIARNVGIEHSTGDYITFVDADDDIDELLISKLADKITQNVDLIMCGLILNGRHITADEITVEGKTNIRNYTLRSLLSTNLLYGPYCKLFRRTLIADNQIRFPTDVDYGEDTIFNLHYLQLTNTISVLDGALYTYQMQPNGLASSNALIAKFRKKRSTSLKIFISDPRPSLSERLIYILIRLRWSIGYAKSIITSVKQSVEESTS